MKKDIRIIALDLDGTTFTTDKRITEHTRKTLKKAIDAGIYVLPCTGRQLSGLPEAFLEIPGVKYAITSNGAAIVDLETGEPIYSNYMDYELAASHMEEFLAQGAWVDAYIQGKCYIDETLVDQMELFITNPRQLEYFRKTRIPVKNLPAYIRKHKLDTEKLHMLFPTDEALHEARAFYVKSPDFEASWALNHNLELNAGHADKGTALMALADILHIPRECTMACGDGVNDLLMLKKAGFSVAMENAVPALKEICDVVTKNNDEDGVAYAVETYIFGN